MAGLRPIVEFMTWNFAMQAIDHIINSAAKTRYMAGGELGCPIVFRGPNGAAARVGAQHSQEYSSWYAHCPGLKVIAPYQRRRRQGPAQGRHPRPEPGRVPRERGTLRAELRRAEAATISWSRSARPRSSATARHVTITAFSLMVDRALKAAEKLAEMGIEAEVIDLRTIRPLDIETIVESVKKTNRIVSVEEGWPQSGMGAEIAAVMMEQAFDWLDAPVVRVHGKDVPMPYAANLERLAVPQVDDIVAAAKAVCYRS